MQNFTTAKAFEQQWRTNPHSRDRLMIALQKAYPERQLLNVHWSHLLNDKAGIDAWLEFKGGTMLAVDFKFRTFRHTDAWVTIETLSDVAEKKEGWAQKVTPCREMLFVRAQVNGVITDVLRVDSVALRELACTRINELKSVGEVRQSKSKGRYSDWVGEFVALKPDSLVDLLPSRAKHVQIVGGAHDSN